MYHLAQKWKAKVIFDLFLLLKNGTKEARTLVRQNCKLTCDLWAWKMAVSHELWENGRIKMSTLKTWHQVTKDSRQMTPSWPPPWHHHHQVFKKVHLLTDILFEENGKRLHLLVWPRFWFRFSRNQVSFFFTHRRNLCHMLFVQQLIDFCAFT